jgi:hypothetical protein
MAHLSNRDQFSPKRSLLRNAKLIIHGFADNRSMDSSSPSLPDEMFYSTHHSFFINQNSQEDSAFEGNAGLTDCLDRFYGSR